MSFWASWRTALRISRRETRRAKGRSAMVIFMIGVPVAALAMFAVTYDMFTLNSAERADRYLGTADARVSWPWHVPIKQSPNSSPIGFFYLPASGDLSAFDADSPQLRPGTRAELLDALPVGSHVYPYSQGEIELKTAAGVGNIDATWADASVNPTDGTALTDGMITMLSGRAPRAEDEIALSPPALDRVGGRLGGTVTSSDSKSTYRIVGIFEEPDYLGQRALLAPRANAGQTSDTWLVDTPGPVTWQEVKRLNQFGIAVNSRELFLHPVPESEWGELPPFSPGVGASPDELTFMVLIAGLALLEIVLMAGPAFAVSARRRARQLALVAANGGTPAHVRRIVLADGVVLGVVGAGVGLVVGAAAAVVGRPIIEEHLAGFRAGGYRFFPTALAAIAVLAVVTGLLAALVPAFVTARQEVVGALAGRRGVRGSKKRWLALGIAGTVAGTAIVVYGTLHASQNIMLAGMVVGELGLVLCTPALVGVVARAGRLLPLAPRIALRDAARNRAAAAPAISAVMAAVAGSVALGLYLDSSHSQQIEAYRQRLPVGYVEVYLPGAYVDEATGEPADVASVPEVEAALRNTTPVTVTHQLHRVGCAPGHLCEISVDPAPSKTCPYAAELAQSGWLSEEKQRAARSDPRCETYGTAGGMTYVDDGSGLEIVTGASGDDLDAALAMLRSGGVVVGDETLIENGKARLRVVDYDYNQRAESTTPPADGLGVAPEPAFDPYRDAPVHDVRAYLLTTGVLPGVILPPSLVESYGLSTSVGSLIAATSRVPTLEEQDALNAQLQRGQAYASVERGPSVQFDVRLLILILAAALITITAAGFGTGLAAADGRADLSTLAAVGASPRVRRVLSLSQSGVIAGLGSLLGAMAGLGAAVAVLSALNFQWADVWPGPDPMPIRIPWLSLAIALLIVPAVSMLGAGLLTRSRLPIERRL